MSNPSTVVETFNDIGGFTPTGAVRFYDGLWLEEGRTNLIANPTAVTDTTGWTPTTNFAAAQETSLPAPLPGWLASRVTTGFRIHATANDTGFGGVNCGLTLTAAAHAFSVLIYIPSVTYTATGIPRLSRSAYTGATGATNDAASLALRDQWQFLDVIFTPDAGDVAGSLFMQISGSGAINSGDEFWIACAQAELGAYPASFSLNSFGAGYSGTTTHIRAASSASVTIAEPAAVACWYREAYSGAKTFAYLDTLGQLGDYGDISYAAGDLTISTSRNLVIGPFAAFSRALTANEQANLRSTQNWSMNSVNGSNIILPLSGRRRPR